MSRLLGLVCAMAIAACCWGGALPFAAAAAEDASASPERGALASSPLAMERASAPLAKDSPLRVRWAVDLKDRNAVRFWLPAPEVAVDYFLLLTDKNDLIAIRRRSGMVAWWTRLPGPPTGDIAFTDYSLYLVIRSHLVCLERNSGEVISRLMLPFPPSAGPAVFEGQERLPLIFIPSLDTKVYALEIDKTIWPPKFGWGAVQQSDFLMEDYILKIVWRWPAHELIAGNIVYHDRFVYLTDAKYNLYGILTTELQGGKPKTVRFFRTQGPMAVGPVISGPYIFVASRDRTLYCLSRLDFGEVWRYPSGEILDSPPAIMDDPYGSRTVVMQKCGTKGPLTGLLDIGEVGAGGVASHLAKVLWQLPDAEFPAARLIEPENEADKRTIVVVRNSDKSLSAHYLSNGQQIWRLPAGAAYHPICLNTQEEFLYTATTGHVICALQKGE